MQARRENISWQTL